MKSWRECFVVYLVLIPTLSLPSLAQNPVPNSLRVPGRILSARIDLSSQGISEDSRQVAKQLNLLPVLSRLVEVRAEIRDAASDGPELSALTEESRRLKEEGTEIITEASLEVDFVDANINEEICLYSDMLAAMTSDRDRSVAISNATSFVSNGALWAIGEGLDIPTYNKPKLSIPSGFFGIIAGVIPSIASLYAMKQVSGSRFSAQEDPNMLAKLFGRTTTIENEYPSAVWNYLVSVPPTAKIGKRRLDLLIDRWIADKNIPGFTNAGEERQVNLISAINTPRKGINISLLTLRVTMLQQLGAEIQKMKRPLFELMLVVRGTKHL